MSHREWRFYLNDMLGFAENVIAYSEGFSFVGWAKELYPVPIKFDQ